MDKNEKSEYSSEITDSGICCCNVVSMISVDERVQMVLPKDIRKKAKIHPGDKLAVVSWEKGEEVCCISLVKVEDLADMVKEKLGPVLKEIITK